MIQFTHKQIVPNTKGVDKMSDLTCLVYTVEEIQHKLFIGKHQAYNLVKSGQFPVLKVSKTYRIPKESFDAWFYGKIKTCCKPADAGSAKK